MLRNKIRIRFSWDVFLVYFLEVILGWDSLVIFNFIEMLNNEKILK